MKSLLILGRQPEIGLAELESLYGADAITSVGSYAVIVDIDPCLLAFDRLGGSVKFAKLLTSIKATTWQEVESFLIDISPKQTELMPEGKMYLGLSAYGYKYDINTKTILATGLKLKRAIQKTGRPVRLVPNKTNELNSAQIIHNKLVSEHGWELLIVRAAGETFIAQTVKVQDIDAYTSRDRERPKRDSRVGMLPPKLAQILINLSVGKLSESELKSICDIPADQTIPPPNLGQTVFDPFCGTGVIAQESLLMGYDVLATDLEPRMISYTNENIKWLKQKFNVGDLVVDSESADATSHRWSQKFDFLASELYLGAPFTSPPSSEVLGKNISNCNIIIRNFLENLSQQTKTGFRLCIAVPAWQTSKGNFKHLPLIDQLNDLGYNVVSFKYLGSESLVYFRPDQVVARQLLVLIRK